MKKLYKVLALVLALLMLAGCTPTTDQPRQPGEKLRVSMLYPWSSYLLSTDEVIDPESVLYDERWQLIMDRFDLSIDYIACDAATMADKLRAMIGGNNMPDVALSLMNMDAREFRLYAEMGGLKVIPEEMLEKYPNIMRNMNSVTAKDSYKVDGGYVAIPRSMDLNGISGDYSYMMIYRKDMAEAAGVTIKDAYTIEEMYDMFEKVQAKFPDVQVASHIWPDQFMQYGLYQYSPYMSSTPVKNFYYDSEAGEYKYAPADPDTIKGIQWFKKMYDAGFINSDYLNLQVNQASTQFFGGSVFCTWNGANAAFLDSIRRTFAINNPELSMDCVDTFLLLDDEGQYIVIQQVSGSSGIPDTYENLDKILHFIGTRKTNPNTKILWNMTWAYQANSTHPDFPKYNRDQMAMYNAIVDTVGEKILTNDGIAGVIPAGTAIQNLRTSYIGDTMTIDGHHLNHSHGRYTAALAWYAAITGGSPEAVTWFPAGYTSLSDHFTVISEAVRNAVETPYSVTKSKYPVRDS